jgi:flagellar hook-basal body complex protein FliE
MTNGFYSPKINLTGRIQNLNTEFQIGSIPTLALSKLDEASGVNFKGVMSNLVQNLNQDLNAPDKLLTASMNKNSDVDIHDVMTAMAKAEMSVSVATQITSKVIQAYDKIMQISV